jgi:predicted Zn finger-like uncharacterized protein
MTLATQCPHCKTTFRVAQDQLKLRAGLVRCGACREIFNGIEHLLPADAPPEHLPPPTPVSEHPPLPPTASSLLDFAYPEFELPQSASQESANSIESIDFFDIQNATPNNATATATAAEVPLDHREAVAPQAAAADELDWEIPTKPMLAELEPTGPDLAWPYPTEPNAAEPSPAGPNPAGSIASEPFLAEIEQPAMDALPADEPPIEAPSIIEQAQHKSARKKKKRNPYAPREDAELAVQPEIDEPDFVKQGRRKQELNRMTRIALWSATVALLLGAFGQAIYAFRDQLAVRLPEARPALLAACGVLHCEIALPTQIENISIESNQLETLSANKDASELTMLLRNMGSTVQAWPHIELTLNDANGSLLARRVFAPRDYLTDTRVAAQGLPSNTEQSVKLTIEVADVKPAGYRVGVFYP